MLFLRNHSAHNCASLGSHCLSCFPLNLNPPCLCLSLCSCPFPSPKPFLPLSFAVTPVHRLWGTVLPSARDVGLPIDARKPGPPHSSPHLFLWFPLHPCQLCLLLKAQMGTEPLVQLILLDPKKGPGCVFLDHEAWKGVWTGGDLRVTLACCHSDYGGWSPVDG